VQSVRQNSLKILERVNRKLDTVFEERFFNLFGEDALSADLCQRGGCESIACGLDDLDLNQEPDMPPLKLRLDPVGLPEREFASTRTDQ
jgi:hypothetical protein